MSEEEKELVEKFNNLYIKEFKGETITDDDRLNYIECALITNLIEKLDKELNSLKEIEKSHQEENGKLKIELEQYKLLEANIDKANKIIAENKFDEGLYGLLMQEKEKNKDLEEKLKIAVAMLTKGTYPEENEGDNDFDKQFIAVDKIKGIQGRLFVQLGSYVQNEASPEQERIAGGINIINKILEV